MNYTNKELEELTLKWGQDRKITINGKIGTQFIKLIEEYGELYDDDSQLNTDEKLLKDSIGDQIVVLTMMNGILGIKFSDINDTLSTTSEFEIDFLLKYISINHGQMASFISKDKFNALPILINKYLYELHLLCFNFGFTINECWNHAYNEIKDRTGYLNEDGCFIKDESISLTDGFDYFKTNKLI